MEDLYLLSPVFFIVGITNINLEKFAYNCVRIGIRFVSHSKIAVAVSSEARGGSHTIKLRDRTCIGENYGRYVLGVGKIKEARRNFFSVEFMSINFMTVDYKLVLFEPPRDA